MVKVLQNVFRGIIFLFAVNNNQICGVFTLFPAAIFVFLGGVQKWHLHNESYKFLLHILKNNSAAENCTDVRLGQVVNLSIFYTI